MGGRHGKRVKKAGGASRPPPGPAAAPTREVARRLPVVTARLSNTSELPQALPILEMKLLDAAGETLAQRVLEPADYGFGGRDAVAPGADVAVRLTVTTPLPYDASSAVVKAVSALQ